MKVEKNAQDLTYEAAMQELESILAALQENRLKVSELEEAVQRAKGLIQYCREKLRQTETGLEDLLAE